MMGIEINGQAQIFCDNEAVVKNGSCPESTINKKHLSIVYHFVRENIAAATIIVFYESGECNLADILTKCLPPDKRKRLMSGIFG